MSWQKGQIYEKKAADYLTKQNYLILEKNWHAGRYGEIDFICLQDFTLIFVEVKGRSGNFAKEASLEAIDYRKAKKLLHSAQQYLQKIENTNYPQFTHTRFDLIAINNQNIDHLCAINLVDFC